MTLLDWQRTFVGYLRGVASLGDSPGIALVTAPRRAEIYRRNVFGSLEAVVDAAFPATRHAMGLARFRVIAAEFVRDSPPTRPALWRYGEDFPNFLAEKMVAGDAPWLVDLAQLELASTIASFAPDLPPFDSAGLAAVKPDQVGELRLAIRPGVTLILSPWPLTEAWSAWREDKPTPLLRPGEDGRAFLVARTNGEVFHRALAPWQAKLYAAWIAGEKLGVAVTLAAAAEEDVQAELAFVLRAGLCVGFASRPAGRGTP